LLSWDEAARTIPRRLVPLCHPRDSTVPETRETPMLGPPKRRDLDRSVLISVESSVPRDHFYRHLHRVLDLSFVRALAADCYATGGRPSVDPEVFFRLQLLMFFSGIRSERQLLEQARYNLAMRWYAGYNLDEPLPDHSSPAWDCLSSAASSRRLPRNASRPAWCGVRS
jgi:transposase-like protein DUF772